MGRSRLFHIEPKNIMIDVTKLNAGEIEKRWWIASLDYLQQGDLHEWENQLEDDENCNNGDNGG